VRVALTGTPGTGKTTASERADTGLDVIHLNEVIEREDLYTDRDEDRGSLVADIDAVRDWLGDREDVLVESHLAHHLDVEKVIVLRCHPEEIERRLEERDEPAETIAENADSEALDVILTEAVETHGLDAVYEIDTTDRSPDAVATEIERVVAGEREPSAGTVSFVEYR
jgi:adenylate kinase